MKPLEPPDSHHLMAAKGWLELNNYLEANEELEKIAPKLKAHPLVLFTRWDIYAKAKKWDYALPLAESLMSLFPEEPKAWINRSFSLHELKRTQEAWNNLYPAAQKFTKNSTIPYNLACYSCQLGKLDEAKEWLELAFDLGGGERLRLMALDDPDLEPLWKNIGEL